MDKPEFYCPLLDLRHLLRRLLVSTGKIARRLGAVAQAIENQVV
jgi:hypothetical protein